MNLEELLAYDFALEEAAAKVIEAGGVTVNLDFVNTKKKAPFVDQISYVAEPTGTRINYQDQKLWHVFRGELTTRFVVARNDNEGRAQLKLLVGRARLCYQLFHKNFNEGPHLPNHFINDMVEGRPARGHHSDQKHDWIELRHTVTLNIRQSAFV
jgi:hypothetical protein